MNINTPYQRLPAKANNGSRLTSKSLYIVLAIAIGAVGLLAFDTQQANYLKKSLRKSTAAADASTDNINSIGLVSSVVDEKNDVLSLRTPEEVDVSTVGSEEDDGEEPLLPAEVDTDTSVGTSDIIILSRPFSPLLTNFMLYLYVSRALLMLSIRLL